MIDLKNIPSTSIERFSSSKKGNKFFGINFLNSALNPLAAPNPLNLKDHGHTQAGKIVAIGSINFWMKLDDSLDAKYHLHLDGDGFSVHTHKHHITRKMKKQRKFSVRCVSE